MRGFRLNLWESALILLGVGLFFVSLFFYATDFPLHRYLFNISEIDGQVQIGYLTKMNGSIKRQVSGAIDFEGIVDGSPLYQMDILVTGPESGASLGFEDGSTAEVGPSTMVRLAFQSELTMSGVSRIKRLDVVTGKVTAQAHKQRVLVTSQNRVFTVVPHTVQSLAIKETAHERTPVLSAPIQVDPQIERPVYVPPPSLPGQGPGQGLAQRQARGLLARNAATPISEAVAPIPTPTPTPIVTAEPPPIPTPVPLPLPSLKPIVRSSPAAPVVPKKPLGPVKLLSLLVGGKSASSNKLQGDLLSNFDIKVRWENYPEAVEYRVWFGASPTAKKAILEKTVANNEYTFNKGKIFTGQFYYKVMAKLGDGRTASSSAEKFSFNFLPPVPVTPPNRALVTQKSIRENDNRLLFTWQKTNFTQAYEIEISTDPKFARIIAKKTFKENYFILPSPSVGQYWWRVRGFTQTLSSPMSQTAAFTVKP